MNRNCDKRVKCPMWMLPTSYIQSLGSLPMSDCNQCIEGRKFAGLVTCMRLGQSLLAGPSHFLQLCRWRDPSCAKSTTTKAFFSARRAITHPINQATRSKKRPHPPHAEANQAIWQLFNIVWHISGSTQKLIATKTAQRTTPAQCNQPSDPWFYWKLGLGCTPG